MDGLSRKRQAHALDEGAVRREVRRSFQQHLRLRRGDERRRRRAGQREGARMLVRLRRDRMPPERTCHRPHPHQLRGLPALTAFRIPGRGGHRLARHRQGLSRKQDTCLFRPRGDTLHPCPAEVAHGSHLQHREVHGTLLQRRLYAICRLFEHLRRDEQRRRGRAVRQGFDGQPPHKLDGNRHEIAFRIPERHRRRRARQDGRRQAGPDVEQH